MDVRLVRFGTGLLLALGLAGVLAASAIWVGRQPWFALRQVVLEGELVHNTPRTVRRELHGALKGMGYFTVDLTQAREAFEAVPWVRRAELRRVWPNRLVARLEEHRVAAYWVRPGRDDRLVNDRGEVFEVNLGDLDDESLPMLSGPEGQSAHVLDMWRALAPRFAGMSAKLDALALTERGSWRATLDVGTTMELGQGTPAEVGARVERFVNTVPQLMGRYERRALESVDLRHSDGYAVRVAGISTIEGGASGVARVQVPAASASASAVSASRQVVR